MVRRSRSRRSTWCSWIALARAVRSSNGCPWAGQDDVHVRPVRRDLVERLEEVEQRIAARVEPADVRRDRRQHVIARQHHALRRVVQAEVVLGVARGVQPDPLPPGELDHLAVVDANGRHRRLEEARGDAGGAHPHAPLERELVALPAPRRRIPRPPARRRLMGRDVLDVQVRRFGAVPDHPEALVGDDLGARLGPHPAGPAEVVGVAVRDDDGVHPPQRDAGAGQALGQRGERASTGQPRVDDGHAAGVLEDVAVDVTEAGHVDRQLGAQHAGGDLGDLGGRALLLLATGAIAHLAMVWGPREQGRGRRHVSRRASIGRGLGPLRHRLGGRLAAAVVEPTAPGADEHRP